MEFIKRLSSAIVLATLIALPLAILESLSVFSIIYFYEIPYLIYFSYYQILGLSFILMMTRNRIKISERDQNIKDFYREIMDPSINRLFRIIFVWSIALSIHQIFLR
jgi:hypothetical protein